MHPMTCSKCGRFIGKDGYVDVFYDGYNGGYEAGYSLCARCLDKKQSLGDSPSLRPLADSHSRSSGMAQEKDDMSDVMLLGVLRMPPECWDDNPADVAQRYARYQEAADRIEHLQEALRTIAYPRRGTPEECWSIEEIAKFAAQFVEREA